MCECVHTFACWIGILGQRTSDRGGIRVHLGGLRLCREGISTGVGTKAAQGQAQNQHSAAAAVHVCVCVCVTCVSQPQG